MADGVQVIWTPWRHHGELVDVREWLFPPSPINEQEDSKLRRNACDQISAWKLRGNLPHAVESTWLLTEALLTDEIQADLIPVFAVKAAYITAISRFVTGLLDSQQDTKFKVSMYAKAQQIGLPAVFVDLRHEATHGDMPPLETLRNAAQRAMQWLWEDYWKTLKGREATTQRQKTEILPRNDSARKPVNELGSVSEDVSGREHEERETMMPSTDKAEARWQRWQGTWDSRPIGT
ncbi:hypothetical protein N7G274_000111 [Stereocaulon virgatum]|uniref:Las1-like protein n=1 Tax=Stereocaulon virgatum TaxID=373712 RepID=A0ABR4AR84_9LECA